MDIAVIGGGHGAYAAAADLAERGHDVRLWRRDGEALAPVAARGALTLIDAKGTRQVPLSLVTPDLGEAVERAELVLIPLPAMAQASLARDLAPHLADGQVVYLPPGTFGSYVMAKTCREQGNTADLLFAETGTLPYLARKRGPDEVAISVRATRLPTGVFPAKHSARAMEVIAQCYPIGPLADALDGALMNAGPVIHPPLIMMNAGPLEHSEDWDIHNEGTQPAIRAVTDALDGERLSLREAVGYGAPHFPLADHYRSDGEEWMYGRAAHEKLVDSDDWREAVDLHRHRYMREDTAMGLAFLVSVAEWVGTPTPVARGLLSIASAIVGEDLSAGPRTLGALGLSSMSIPQLRELLREGH